MTTRHVDSAEVLRETLPRHSAPGSSARVALEGVGMFSRLVREHRWLLAAGLCAVGLAAGWRAARHHAA